MDPSPQSDATVGGITLNAHAVRLPFLSAVRLMVQVEARLVRENNKEFHVRSRAGSSKE